MGNPLGPTLANTFLCYYEKKWLKSCPKSYRPLYYKRYVDDIFVLFKNSDQAEKFKMLTIFGDGHQGRNFLYVGDMCEAQVKLLDNKAENKIYNLGSEKIITVREIADEIKKHYPIIITYIPQARVEPKIKNVSSEKMFNDFGCF